MAAGRLFFRFYGGVLPDGTEVRHRRNPGSSRREMECYDPLVPGATVSAGLRAVVPWVL